MGPTSFSWLASRASKAYAPIKQYNTTKETKDTWEKTHLKNFQRNRRNLMHLEGFSASIISSNASGRERGILTSASNHAPLPQTPASRRFISTRPPTRRRSYHASELYSIAISARLIKFAVVTFL